MTPAINALLLVLGVTCIRVSHVQPGDCGAYRLSMKGAMGSDTQHE